MDKHLWEEEGGRTDRKRQERQSPLGMALRRPQIVEGTDGMRAQHRGGWRGSEAGETEPPDSLSPRPQDL